MVESILGREQADDIFLAAALSGMVGEKRACEVACAMEKEGAGVGTIAVAKEGLGLLSSALGSVGKGGKSAIGTLGALAGLVGKTAVGGVLAGALGANAYDILKQQVTLEDPETEYKNKVEALYAAKKRELEDAKWMDRVRSMRDELRRGYKKMTTEEYAEKYQALIDALDERKG